MEIDSLRQNCFGKAISLVLELVSDALSGFYYYEVLLRPDRYRSGYSSDGDSHSYRTLPLSESYRREFEFSLVIDFDSLS